MQRKGLRCQSPFIGPRLNFPNRVGIKSLAGTRCRIARPDTGGNKAVQDLFPALRDEDGPAEGHLWSFGTYRPEP